MKTKQLTHAALAAGFITVAAQIVIPVGLVPFTLQVFALYLISFIYDFKTALLSVVLYQVMGFIGLPVFNNFQSGFFTPTIGFVFGFSGVVLINNIFKDKLPYPIPFILSSLYLYTLGLLGLHLVLYFGFQNTLKLSDSIIKYALVFIPSDFIAYTLAHKIYQKVSSNLKVQTHTL